VVRPVEVAGDAVRPQLADTLRQVVAAGQHDTALAGGRDLDRVETEHRACGKPAVADGAAGIGRAEGVRGVLHDGETVLAGERGYLRQIAGQSTEM